MAALRPLLTKGQKRKIGNLRRPLLTKGQKRKIGNLMAAHRAVEECADYEDSPTIQAMIRYVNCLIQTERYKQG